MKVWLAFVDVFLLRLSIGFLSGDGESLDLNLRGEVYFFYLMTLPSLTILKTALYRSLYYPISI